jgi:serine/threonine protein kinase
VRKSRSTPPRRLGLLQSHGRDHGPAVRGSFPYAAGDRIAGDLTITGHLAAGRIGHVYQVWSASEWCALTCKILDPTKRDSVRDREALDREAEVLRAVSHPNVVRFFGDGEHDGLPFLLLEYLSGPSLFDLIEQTEGRRLSPHDTVRAAIHLAAALYHVHRHGYLHLDLKPANLLLRDEVPVLIDLDTARPMDAPVPEEPQGTPPYMALEQIECGTLSPATDVYGLGAVLYELLTGRWPFEDAYLDRESRSGLARQYPQITREMPPPPGRFEPGLPEALDAIVLRCLEPDPERRYPSMHPLMLDLSELLEGSVALWPAGTSAERRKTPRA